MSLSVGDVLDDPSSLGPLFESSVNIGMSSKSIPSSSISGSTHMARAPPRRIASGDLLKIERGAYEMSVNTISDVASDFGDSTLMRMTMSQDDMSFLHVFDDHDRNRDV